MENLLRGIIRKKSLVYLEDVIIFVKTFAEHLENQRCLREAPQLKIRAIRHWSISKTIFDDIVLPRTNIFTWATVCQNVL